MADKIYDISKFDQDDYMLLLTFKDGHAEKPIYNNALEAYNYLEMVIPLLDMVNSRVKVLPRGERDVFSSKMFVNEFMQYAKRWQNCY